VPSCVTCGAGLVQPQLVQPCVRRERHTSACRVAACADPSSDDTTLLAGTAGIVDLRMQLMSEYAGPFHYVSLLKRALLDAVADDAGAQRVGDLRYKLGVSLRDPIVHQWLSSLRPALTVGSSEISGVYADHVALAFASHMARAYGDMRVVKFRCAAD
jgi:hypothetical protein